MAELPANQVVEECASTNDLARKLGEAGFPHGTWISTRRQTRGRGRLGREWTSEEGNLFLSVIVRLERPELWTWVPLAAAAGVAGELRRRFPEKDVRIKWPNDLWLVNAAGTGAKLGGILCEGVGNRAGSFIVAGLGLNVARAPAGLDQETARLGGDADELRAAVLAAILGAVDVLRAEGAPALARRYESFAALGPGTPIAWRSERGEFAGEVRGLGPSGELRVKLADGSETSLYAEDVRVRPR